MAGFNLKEVSQEHAEIEEARKICARYGQIKTLLLQGLRTGDVGGGVCSAIVHAWIRDGVIQDGQTRKQVRKDFRADFNSIMAMMPEHIDNQQSPDQWLWTPRKSVASGPDIKIGYWSICQAIQTLEVAKGSPAYFYLSVDGKDGKRHAVGLKRGKLQNGSIRHFSFLDPNYFEVTRISALADFLRSYCTSVLKDYRKWELGYLSPTLPKPLSTPAKPMQPTLRKADDGKSLDDMLSELNEMPV
jgi:hypothetical protein